MKGILFTPPTQSAHITSPPPPGKFTPVSEKVVVPSGEVDNMAQIVALEPSNKMCRHIFNCREPDLCLLTSRQLCPPKLPFGNELSILQKKGGGKVWENIGNVPFHLELKTDY